MAKINKLLCALAAIFISGCTNRNEEKILLTKSEVANSLDNFEAYVSAVYGPNILPPKLKELPEEEKEEVISYNPTITEDLTDKAIEEIREKYATQNPEVRDSQQNAM